MSTEPAPNATQWNVGVDGSSDAHAALQWAAHMASERGERVTPIGGAHLPLAVAAMAGGRDSYLDRAGIHADATVAAERTLDAVDTRGVVDEPVVLEGHPASLLIDRADGDAVIVVGRRGITALKHRLLGSVSQYLATHAETPVVVVPDGWDQRVCDRIIVGFDGSQQSRAALRWAIDIAGDDTHIVALSAIDVAPWLSTQLALERQGGLIEAAMRRLDEAAEAVDPNRRAERSIVLRGPRHALTEAMVDADLVVVGPRGLGGLARALLGSLTTWLVSTAPCPVAVIPPPTDV